MKETCSITALLLVVAKFWVLLSKVLATGLLKYLHDSDDFGCICVRKFDRGFGESRQLKFRNSGNSDTLLLVRLCETNARIMRFRTIVW